MFDLSFWEILVIGIIAIIVVGPERLPGMAYTAGKWITKVKRFVANAKAEVESEFNTAELRKLMSAQEEEMQKLRKLVEDTRHDVEQSQHALTQVLDDAAQSVREASVPSPAVDTPPPSLSKAPTPAAPPAHALADEMTLPAMTAQSIEDEMHLMSQSLGETLHRPSFGSSSGVDSQVTPPSITEPNAVTPAPKANA